MIQEIKQDNKSRQKSTGDNMSLISYSQHTESLFWKNSSTSLLDKVSINEFMLYRNQQ